MGSFYLVGPMGAGKTTIGRMLAESLSLPFYDVDREVEDRSGVDIPWIFDMEGEQGFRDRESAMLDELGSGPRAVIATGGGAVIRDENRSLMSNRGVVIYLCTTVEEQIRRTAKDRKRPLLQKGNPEETLRKLMAEREPLYVQVADLTLQTDENSPRLVVQNIVAQLRELGYC
ncbi:shikimate kinase AroK [Spongiibacter sp. KMU-158]|uniref:Shikimate kinase n=1 Tax=Spongiibacter pelagi TaxID=2760804 RepID=A0A927GV34_9GAMM|nr:shikimate kinase AroK [Spongiibacter pelagi]